MSIEFWLVSLVVVLIPGTGVVYTVSCGVAGGFRRGFWAAIGGTLGIVPHMVASIVGLAAILHTSAVAFQVLKYAGVAYLLFLAWQLAKNPGISTVSADRGTWVTVRRAFLMNILNPKLTLFFLAFLPPFVTGSGAEATLQLVMLSLAFMALTLVVFLGYAALAHGFREGLLRRPRVVRYMNRTFAGLLAFFGVQLALSER